jgi:tetratricopeptide (TPR) repeat protein
MGGTIMRPVDLRRIAAAAFLLAIQIAPSFAASRDLRACLDHDDKDRARAACGRVLDPGSGASKSDRIRAYESRGGLRAGADDAAAAADYRAAGELDPKNIGLLQKLGNSYVQASEYDRAIDAYIAILRLRPGNVDALMGRGDAYMKNTPSDPDSAINDFDLILRQHPRNEVAMTMRGLALADRGDLEGAIAQFDKALAINRNSFGRLYRTTTIRARDEFKACNEIRGSAPQIPAATALEGMKVCSEFLGEGYGSPAQKGRAIIHRAALYRVWRDLNPP